jgi:hypothetical protein
MFSGFLEAMVRSAKRSVRWNIRILSLDTRDTEANLARSRFPHLFSNLDLDINHFINFLIEK